MNRIAGLLAVLAVSTPLLAKDLRWSEIGSLTGRTVELRYADGATVSGRATSFENGQLIVDVRKTTNAAAHPAGRLAVAQGSFQEMRARRERSRGRIIGSIAGIVGGLLVGTVITVYNVFNEDGGSGGLVALSIGAAAGIATAGYFIGRATDRTWETITVVQ